MPSKFAGRGYCASCEEDVDVYMVDCGIGSYEYWGARGTHHDWQPECSQCGSYMESFEAFDLPDEDYYSEDYPRTI